MDNNQFTCLNSDFKLFTEIKKLIVYIDSYIYANFPKEKKHLKIKLFDKISELYEFSLMANYNSSKTIKRKYQIQMLSNISYIDFLITYFFDLNIINKRRFSSCQRLISNIRKTLYGWINETKE